MPNKSIVLISGSLREQSTNSAALRTATTLCPEGWTAHIYGGMRDLPHFDPDIEEAQLPEAVAEMRGAIGAADAVLICTPEYAGSLPGSFKNLLDWTVGGMEIVDKPSAWINISSSPTKAAGAHAALEVVLGYTGADIVAGACAHVPVSRADVNAEGLVSNGQTESRIQDAIAALVAHVHGVAGTVE